MNYLTEANAGNLGFFYHGDSMSPHKFLDAISNGTYNNTSSMYGKGLYCVRTPIDAFLNSYGPYIYKIYVRNLRNFLHLDRPSFSMTYPNEAAKFFGKRKSENMARYEGDERTLYPGGKGEIPENMAWNEVQRAYDRSSFTVDNYARYSKFTNKENDIEFIRWQLEQKGFSRRDRLGWEVLHYLTDKMAGISKSAWTSELFYHIQKPVMEMGFEGVAYTGQQDRRCLLVYNFTNVVPVAYTIHPKAYPKDNIFSDNAYRKKLDNDDRYAVSDYMNTHDNVEMDRVKMFASMTADSDFREGIKKSISNYRPNDIGPKAIGFARKWCPTMMEMIRNHAVPSMRSEMLIDKMNQSPKLASRIMEKMKEISTPTPEEVAEHLKQEDYYIDDARKRLDTLLAWLRQDRHQLDNDFIKCLFFLYKSVVTCVDGTFKRSAVSFHSQAIYHDDFSHYLKGIYLIGAFMDDVLAKLKDYKDTLEKNASDFGKLNADFEFHLQYMEKITLESKMEEYMQGLENLYRSHYDTEEMLKSDGKYFKDNFVRRYVRNLYLQYCEKEAEILDTYREILTVSIPTVLPIARNYSMSAVKEVSAE